MKLPAILAIAIPVLATALEFPSNFESVYFNDSIVHDWIAKRQSNGPVVLGSNSDVHQRLEIRQMESQQSRQLTLLFLAMARFQQGDKNTPRNYYGMSKIHGVPRVSWDNVGQCSNCADANGYCQHNSPLFPCWHRAYMALFERQFLDQVNAIAFFWPKENDGDNFRAAAETMRFPYLDWAAAPPNGGPVAPQSITSPKVNVYNPDGNTYQMDNPLYSYHFADPSDMVYENFVTWRSTVRQPQSTDANADSRDDIMNQWLAADQSATRQSVYNLLVGCSSYVDMANDLRSGCGNSLEQIHNNLHNTFGGPADDPRKQGLMGHMTVLAEASFDPIFWLHHSNVDRLFALWQAMQSDYNVYGNTEPMASWTFSGNTPVDGNTGMTPFRKDTYGNFWTCNDVRDHRVFGYTYPELSNPYVSPLTYINNLYGPNANAPAGSSKRDVVNSTTVNSTMSSSTSSNSDGEVSSIMDAVISPFQNAEGHLLQYFATLSAPRFGLDSGSYNIYALKKPIKDLSEFKLDNLIGKMGVFSQPGMKSDQHIIHGQIPLTDWARDAQKSGQVKDLGHSSMTAFLKKNLQIVISDGTKLVDPKSLSGFKINIQSSTLNPNAEKGGQFFTAFNNLTDVTESLLNDIVSLFGGIGKIF